MSTIRTNSIRRSTNDHAESLRQTKSLTTSSKITNHGQRVHSFSKTSIVREHYVANKLNGAHRSRLVVHTKIGRHPSEARSSQKNRIEPLQTQTLDNDQLESSMRTRSHQSMKIKRGNKHERSNSPTTTVTDIDTRLSEKDPRTQQKNGNRIVINERYRNSTFSNKHQIIAATSNYQSQKPFSNLANKKNARREQIESIPSVDPILSKERNCKKKSKHKWARCAGYDCCRCSPCCIVFSILTSLLLLAGLAALLIALIGTKKAASTVASYKVTYTTSTTTTSSTATSTTTTSPTTTATTTTTTMVTSSTSASTTTTTIFNCGQSCLNQSWINTSGGLAWWPFDGSYLDSFGVYNGYPSPNLPSFVTGYIGKAALFNASATQAMYTPFIPLDSVSFTVQAWIQPTGYPNPSDHSIAGLCPSQNTNYCLHINIRNQKLYFGFYYNDVQGTTTISLDQWVHTAFVFDISTMRQTIYLNGFQDAQSSVWSALLVASGNFTIGTNEGVVVPYNYYQGYIDELSINRRAMSSCEILERATLAAYFKFDTSSPYNDSGPNAVATTTSTTSIVTGYLSQAISLTGSPSSHFQASGFTSLGISNQAFSITFWIKPQTLSGTLVHLSSSSSGTGSTCFPLLGFASNGAIVAQVLTSGGTVATAAGPVLPTSSWIPVVQTWSATNGLNLYVNNTLVSSAGASTFLGSSTTPNYLTLGGCLSGCGACSSGAIGSAGPFTGAIDDWRIYNRELTAIDVCTLYNYF